MSSFHETILNNFPWCITCEKQTYLQGSKLKNPQVQLEEYSRQIQIFIRQFV